RQIGFRLRHERGHLRAQLCGAGIVSQCQRLTFFVSSRSMSRARMPERSGRPRPTAPLSVPVRTDQYIG
ncbi:hypothetical protein AB0M22_45125, partial [Nocardia sp. NPDC051756]|uniref:hypothetical protein n=1 Tax=Nocardia sp. NPDC051756 TaxID=3154751 RepID=UPI0034467525